MITPRPDQTNMLCPSEADARAVQAVHGGRVGPYESSLSWLWYRAPAPVARRTDPITSHEAAGRARLRAQEKADLLLIAHADAGTRGLTGDDIETATGFAYEDIGPRRPGLESDEYVVKVLDDAGRPVKRNNKQVYRITNKGLERANQLRSNAA